MWIRPFTHRVVRLAIAAVTVAVVAPAPVNAQQDAVYEVVSSFDLSSFPGGREPSSLCPASDGTFYGTTSFGGLFDKGVLFQMDGTGVLTPLHSFSDAEGSQPFGLVRSNERFYGLTQQGGQFGSGTVFAFTPGSAPKTVHAFPQGVTPVDVDAASDGNVYGLAAYGSSDSGDIFVIDPGGSYRTLLTIPRSGVAWDLTSLVRASDGRFYVTAQMAPVGPAGFGTIFTVDEAGTVTTIHNFTGGDGGSPVGLMQRRSDGVVFGAATDAFDIFRGLVYSIDPSGHYRVVHSFTSTEGRPLGLDLVEASDGNLYGLTTTSLFRIDSSDALTIVANVGGPSPADLTLGTDERLYGPTAIGGTDGGGTIIRIDLAGTRTTIFEFSIGEGPAQPTGVIQARDGRFYGTTSGSFISSQQKAIGTVFAMDAAGTRTTLHTFFENAPFRNDGSPIGHLFEGADRSVYGTTYTLASYLGIPTLPAGQIFKIDPDGLFTQLASARGMEAGVIQARDGKLYGVTTRDPAGSAGRTFRVEENGTLTTLQVFLLQNPVGELVEIDDRSLYGATVRAETTVPVSGNIFQVDPVTGMFAIRHQFTDGASPTGRLIQGIDGLLYGTTVNGGDFGLGTVFSLDAAGTLTTLHHFSDTDGANANAGLVQGLDGRLYGTTTNGGAYGYGTVFVMNVTGGLTTLHDFALSDGAHPASELFQANDGAFYGAAPIGGPKNGGVIFRVRLETLPSDQYVEIVSRSSGKCLDVIGASTGWAASVIQWTCHGGANQQWRLEPVGGGAFRLVARHSGQVLDVYGALLDDVTPIIQWPAHGGDNQAWTLGPAPDGYVSIVARHSGKALDVEFASTDDGARVIQFTPHGGANQQWLLRAVESTASSVTP